MNEDGQWVFTWPADSGDYSIWLDGVLLSTVTTEEYTYDLAEEYINAPPPLEIVNSADDADSAEHPPFAIIQWRGTTTAAQYVLEEVVDAVATERKTIFENGSGYYAFQTPVLTDCASATWQVIPIDEDGNEGDPLSFTAYIVRNPDAPQVSIAIAGGTVTVSVGA